MNFAAKCALLAVRDAKTEFFVERNRRVPRCSRFQNEVPKFRAYGFPAKSFQYFFGNAPPSHICRHRHSDDLCLIT